MAKKTCKAERRRAAKLVSHCRGSRALYTDLVDGCFHWLYIADSRINLGECAAARTALVVARALVAANGRREWAQRKLGMRS